MVNIYEIKEWSSGTTYNKCDIVFYNYLDTKYFWYSMVNGSTTSAPTISNPQWGGAKFSQELGKVKPNFIWKPSYNFSVASNPKSQVLKFGDGYEQRTLTDIHPDLVKATVSFEGRTNNEAKAIAHFFAARKGTESFIFKLPPPYAVEKLFVSRNWNYSMKFFDNNTISTTFEEVTV